MSAAQGDGSKTVWIAEEGEYEQRMVMFVAASPDSALDEVKARHPPPSEIAWTLDREASQLIGVAERAVMGHHIAGRFVYDLTEEKVV